MPDKKKILYDAVSKDYNVGTFDEFSAKLNDPAKRKAFYDGVGKEYSLGTYDEFESKVSNIKKKDSTGLPSTSSGTPSAYQSPQEKKADGFRGKLSELDEDDGSRTHYNNLTHQFQESLPQPFKDPASKTGEVEPVKKKPFTLSESMARMQENAPQELADNTRTESLAPKTKTGEYKKTFNAEGTPVVREEFLVEKTKNVLPDNQEEFAGQRKVNNLDVREVPEIVGGALLDFTADMSRSIAANAKELNLFGEYDDKKVQDLATYKFAEWLTEIKEEYLPVSQESQDSFLGQVTQAASSMVPFILGGVAGKALKLGEFAVPAMMGAAQNGGAEYKRALEMGADEETAFKAWLGAAVVGTTEGLPIASWMKRVDGATGGLFHKSLGKYMTKEGMSATGQAAMGALEEGAQEAISTYLTNLSANQIYDETRKLWEGVAEAGMLGGLLGATLNGITAGLSAKKQDPNLTPQERIMIDKAEMFIEAKRQKVEGMKPNEFAKVDDDSPAVQELKKQKTQLEVDMVNDNLLPIIKEKVAAKIEEIDKAIEVAKAEDIAKDGQSVQAEAESTVLTEQLASLEAMKEQASSPETKELIQEDIDGVVQNLESLKELIPNEQEKADTPIREEVLKQEDKGGAENVTPVVEKPVTLEGMEPDYTPEPNHKEGTTKKVYRGYANETPSTKGTWWTGSPKQAEVFAKTSGEKGKVKSEVMDISKALRTKLILTSTYNLKSFSNALGVSEKEILEPFNEYMQERIKSGIEKAHTILENEGIQKLLKDKGYNMIEATENHGVKTSAKSYLVFNSQNSKKSPNIAVPNGKKSKQNTKTPASKQVAKSNDTEGVQQPDGIPKKKKITRRGTPRDERQLRGKNLEAAQLEVETPRDLALQWFVNKGRLTREAVAKFTNSDSETNKRVNIIAAKDAKVKGKTIDAIAHDLWENQPYEDRHSTEEFKDAVEEVINDHEHWISMADELLDTHAKNRAKEKIEQQIYEKSIKESNPDKEITEEESEAALHSLELMNDEEIEALAEGKDAVTIQIAEEIADDWLTREAPEDDGSTPWDDMPPKNKFDDAIDALNKLKADTKGKVQAFGLLPATWNAAIDIIIAAVKAGKHISIAIKDAIDYIKAQGETVDEAAFTKQIEAAFKPKEVVEAAKEAKQEKKPESEKKESPREKRKFTQQGIKVYPNIEPALDDDTIHYDRLPNSVTLAEANAIIDYLGVEEAAKAFTDLTNGMTMPVRNTVGQVLIKRLESEGEVDKAIDVLEELTKRATEMGQGIQALSMFQFLSPEGALRSAQREVNKQRDVLKKKNKKKLEKLDKGLADINKEAAESAVTKVVEKSDIDKIKPRPTKTPASYGSKNKVVSKKRYEELKKALKGKLFSNIPPEIIEIAIYHAEATGRKATEFAKNMISDFGGKIRPYLKELYKKAKGDLKDKGYTDEDFASDEEISAAIAESFTDKDIQKSVKEGIKDLGISVKDVVIKHYTVYDTAKRTLVEKLVQDAGLEMSEATTLASAIQKEFDRVATEKKKKLIDSLLSTKERKKPEAKSLEDDLIKMTNLGAFSNDEVVKQYGDKMGWPKLTKENLKEIERLAGIVQSSPEGFKKFRAIEDLLSYQAKLKGVSKWDIALSIWYANILAGYKTQLVNIVSNITNSMLEFTTAVLQNPKTGILLAKGYLKGIAKGFPEANATLRTGYSPIRGKVEIPPALERVKWTGFGKLFKYHKYVRRAMVAADVLFFEGLKEMRAWQWAAKSAANENKLHPDEKMKKAAMNYMNFNDATLKEANATAEQEYQEDLEKINSLDLTPKEKAKRLKEAKEDRRRRVNELIEGKRPSNVLEESRSFAARGTYNYKPEGVLGALSEGANMLGEKVSLFRLVVPFTNIIANVANQGLNFTPWGFIRAAAPQGTASSLFSEKLGRKDWDSLTSEQQSQAKVDLMTKAIQGTALMSALLILSQKWDDDDEPFIEITANGTGDYRKNYQLQETGWQPYSIRIGGRWYSYQFSPLLPGLSFIGNLNDYDKYRKEKITDEGMGTKVGAAATASMRTFLDGTFLANMNTFLSTIVETSKENIQDDAIKALMNTGRGFVVPNLYTQAAKDIQSIFDIPTKETSGTLMGQILRDVPVARDKYSNKINVLGEEIIPDTDKFSSGVKDSPAFQLIVDKKAWIAPLSIRKTTIEDPETEEPRLMTQEEFYEFSKFRGEYIKTYILDHLQELQEMDAEEVRKELETVKGDATDEAKTQLLAKIQND